MAVIKVLGANVPRANKGIIKQLMDAGLIYVGEDNQLHVREQKNISTQTAKSE